MYLYLYRGSSSLQALTLGAGSPEMVDNDGVSNKLTWTAHQGDTRLAQDGSALDRYFPLFYYFDKGNAARAPGLGLFRYTDGNNVPHIICLINWHNDACNSPYIKGNIRRLADTPIIKQGNFNITLNPNGVRTVDNIVIAGDFNDKLVPNRFANYTRHIKENTHLHHFDKDNDDTYRDSTILRDELYDNLLTRLNGLTGLTAGSSKVIDLPDRLMEEKTGETKNALLSSDLLAPVNQQNRYRTRLTNGIRSIQTTG